MSEILSGSNFSGDVKDNSKSSKTANKGASDAKENYLKPDEDASLCFQYLMTIQISWTTFQVKFTTIDLRPVHFLGHFDHLFTFLHWLTTRFCAHYSFFGFI